MFAFHKIGDSRDKVCEKLQFCHAFQANKSNVNKESLCIILNCRKNPAPKLILIEIIE